MNKKKLPQNCAKIKELKKQAKLTYQELSELTGIKINTLTCYVTGKRSPSDVITNMIVDKINTYLKGGSRYINVDVQRGAFMQRAYDVFPVEDARKIMEMFDEIPTVLFYDKE